MPLIKPPRDKRREGIYNKFMVVRTDGQSAPNQKHEKCDYFVLDLTHDKFARAAILAYAKACAAEYPALSKDLFCKAYRMYEPDHAG